MTIERKRKVGMKEGINFRFRKKGTFKVPYLQGFYINITGSFASPTFKNFPLLLLMQKTIIIICIFFCIYK